MKTRRFCPRCARPVVKSRIKSYAFRCYCCDEDFYRFEVLSTKDLNQIKKIRRQTILWERQNEYISHSVYKPYPQYNG